MPTLDWLGKDKAIKASKEVRFRLLTEVPEYSYGDKNTGNMIVHGDNLEALKALLPYYNGMVKCIYIDPPYNTGSAFVQYDDNLEHSIWLSMMYPRLELLREFLREDGSIWISIDDREYANLKLICDEIFGLNCFVSNISWQRTYSTRNDSKGIVNEVEHILVYSSQPDWQPHKLPRTDDMNSKYKNPDNDVQSWTSSDAFAADANTHQGMVYAIQHPFTGKLIYPSRSAHWRYKQEDMLKIMRGWCEYELKDLHDEHERAVVCGISDSEVRPGIMAIVLTKSLAESAKMAKEVYDRGQWPRFYFTRGGKGGVRRKTYITNVGGKLPTNLWPYVDTGHTDEAKKEILALFTNQSPFDTPKPERLLKRVLFLASDPGDIVMDTFLGSGTTAAVAQKMNRHFIGVELEDTAFTHVVPRLQKVVDGEQGGISKAEKWEGGGGYKFYRLGDPLYDDDGLLNKSVNVKELGAFIFYKETQTSIPENSAPPFLGTVDGISYYLLYSSDKDTCLNLASYKALKAIDGKKVIYADICRMSAKKLKEEQIEFKQIPYDLIKLGR